MAASRELKDTLWKAAEKLRGSLSAGQYKGVVLGLIFLKDVCKPQWQLLSHNVNSPDLGRLVDHAMRDAMAASPRLAGLLPQHYGDVDTRRLGELIEVLDSAQLTDPANGRARDLMGEVYEYFLGKFARADGRRGGEFFTPPSIVGLIVDILEPAQGRVYDPCCGSGGMFVQVERFVADHGGDRVSIYGQESVEETWRMARMNLAVHGIDDAGLARGDTFVRDLHVDVQMDYVMANPPFNIKDWARDEHDPRWRFGVPPAGNANFGWIQHILSKLAPQGKAAVVMTNGSMSSNTSGEGGIRARILDADLVSGMVALPAQLFRSTGIPVCLWIFDKDKARRSGQVLFIDAREFGFLIDRTERVLTDDEITRIGTAYHAWLSGSVDYQDVSGFCKAATLDDIRESGYVLSPGRYVGAASATVDEEPVDCKIARLTTDLVAALDDSARLDQVVRDQLERVRWR